MDTELWIISLMSVSLNMTSSKCDALRDLISSVQFQKLKKHPWRSITLVELQAYSNTPPWMFSMFTP